MQEVIVLKKLTSNPLKMLQLANNIRVFIF